MDVKTLPCVLQDRQYLSITLHSAGALATRAHEIETRSGSLYAELDQVTRAHEEASGQFEAQAAALAGGWEGVALAGH